MIKQLKKHPFAYTLFITIAAILTANFFIQNIIILRTEKELSQLMHHAKISKIKTDDLFIKADIQKSEDNGTYFYKKAYDEITGSNPDVKKISELIKTGNMKNKFYPYDVFNKSGKPKALGLQKSYAEKSFFHANISWDNMQIKTNRKIGEYYRKIIYKQINNDEVKQAYGNIRDWIRFINQSYRNDNIKDNGKNVVKALEQVSELDDANEVLTLIMQRAPIYDGELLQEIEDTIADLEKIPDSSKKITLINQLNSLDREADAEKVSTQYQLLLAKTGLIKRYLREMRSVEEYRKIQKLKKEITEDYSGDMDMADLNFKEYRCKREMGSVSEAFRSKADWINTLKWLESFKKLEQKNKTNQS